MATRVWGAGSAGGVDYNITNAANWTGDTLPVSGDDIVFDGLVSNNYCIGQFAAPIDLNSVTIRNNYAGYLEVGGQPGTGYSTSQHIQNIYIDSSQTTPMLDQSYIVSAIKNSSSVRGFGNWTLAENLLLAILIVAVDSSDESDTYTLSWNSLNGKGFLYFLGNYGTNQGGSITLNYPGSQVFPISSTQIGSFLGASITLDKTSHAESYCYIVNSNKAVYSTNISDISPWMVHPGSSILANKIVFSSEQTQKLAIFSPDYLGNNMFAASYYDAIKADIVEFDNVIIATTFGLYILESSLVTPMLNSTPYTSINITKLDGGSPTVNFRGRSGLGLFFHDLVINNNVALRFKANITYVDTGPITNTTLTIHSIPQFNFYDESYCAVNCNPVVFESSFLNYTSRLLLPSDVDYGNFVFHDDAENLGHLPIWNRYDEISANFPVTYFSYFRQEKAQTIVGEFLGRSKNKFLGFAVPETGRTLMSYAYIGCLVACIKPKWVTRLPNYNFLFWNGGAGALPISTDPVSMNLDKTITPSSY